MAVKYRTHYHILNSVAGPISKHNVSAAGPVGYQHYTPVLDTELLLYGRPRTPLPDTVSPNLDTGSVSPMMPVRAILSELKHAGRHAVDVKVFNLGSNPIPAVRSNEWFDEHDDELFPVTTTTLPLPTHNAAPPFWQPRASHLRAISHAAFSLAFQIYTESTPRDWNILAECVPGGTTTAALWLSLAAGQPLTTPSSSHCAQQNARKAALIAEWWEGLAPYATIDSTEALWQFALTYGDYYQIFILAFLYEFADLMKYDRGATARNPILLAGGSQAAAPLALFKKVNPQAAALLAPYIKLVTTPWVMAASDTRIFNDLINPFVADANYAFAFRPEDGPYYLYERGYTKEGCGLGALLWYASIVHGINTATLRYWCRDILTTYNLKNEVGAHSPHPSTPAPIFTVPAMV